MSKIQHEQSGIKPENTPAQQKTTSPSPSAHNGSESIHSASSSDNGAPEPEMSHITTHISHTQDVAAPMQNYSSYIEVPDEVYDRLAPSKKLVIVALLSYCSFLAPISSTTILSAIPEVASTYSSTGTVINLSNALYMLFMGISPAFWGPLSQVYGRRNVSEPPPPFPKIESGEIGHGLIDPRYVSSPPSSSAPARSAQHYPPTSPPTSSSGSSPPSKAPVSSTSAPHA